MHSVVQWYCKYWVTCFSYLQYSHTIHTIINHVRSPTNISTVHCFWLSVLLCPFACCSHLWTYSQVMAKWLYTFYLSPVCFFFPDVVFDHVAASIDLYICTTFSLTISALTLHISLSICLQWCLVCLPCMAAACSLSLSMMEHIYKCWQ